MTEREKEILEIDAKDKNSLLAKIVSTGVLDNAGFTNKQIKTITKAFSLVQKRCQADRKALEDEAKKEINGLSNSLIESEILRKNQKAIIEELKEQNATLKKKFGLPSDLKIIHLGESSLTPADAKGIINSTEKWLLGGYERRRLIKCFEDFFKAKGADLEAKG